MVASKQSSRLRHSASPGFPATYATSARYRRASSDASTSRDEAVEARDARKPRTILFCLRWHFSDRAIHQGTSQEEYRPEANHCREPPHVFGKRD